MTDDFYDRLKETLDAYQYPPEMLEIELTESSIMDDKEHTKAILQKLKDNNIGISIDDFGTGYSSLNYLKQFPVTKLKIDRAFVMNCLEDINEQAIIKTIISLGHNFGLKVVAEGIENQEQFNFLKNIHCDIGQGFFLGRPMRDKKFRDFLLKQNSS